MADSYSFGSHVPTTSWGKEVTGEKSAFLAIILSFFFPGVGVMYAGKIGFGLILLILADIVSIALMFVIVGFITYPIIWIYSMYKGYVMCEENNRLWTQYLASR